MLYPRSQIHLFGVKSAGLRPFQTTIFTIFIFLIVEAVIPYSTQLLSLFDYCPVLSGTIKPMDVDLPFGFGVSISFLISRTNSINISS